MEDLQRLQKLYNALKERGVVDIKWCESTPRAKFLMGDIVCQDSPELVKDKILVLEQYMAGNYYPFQGIGDSVRENVNA